MTAKITAYLDRVQAVTDAATPGPWTATHDSFDACEWESLLNPFYSESNAAEHDLVCDCW